MEINNQLILIEKPIAKIDTQDWSRKSLRQCLLALGLTDKEIRYRKGARYIFQNWTGEEKDLLELIKKKWKNQVRIHHEANNGDPEQWKNVNSLYSTILKKSIPYIKGNIFSKCQEIHEYNCFICKKTVIKKILNNSFKRNSKICNDLNCKRLYHNFRVKRYRQTLRTRYEKFCTFCGERFFTFNSHRKYDKTECRDERNKLTERGKYKTKSYKERWQNKTLEERKEYNRRHYEKAKARRDLETPQKRELRLVKERERNKLRYANLTAEQKMVQKLKHRKTEKERILEKREQYKDKPYLFETWLQQLYLRKEKIKIKNSERNKKKYE